MTIQEFLSQTTTRNLPLSELTTIAADRAAFGDDVIAAFRTQIELRAQSAQAVLDAATAANRDSLLASEQRGYDAALRERDSILSLQHAIERRSEQRTYVPPSQTPPRGDSNTTSIGPVLAPEQRVVSWLESRGGRVSSDSRSAIDGHLSFGRVVRAWALGDRRGLTELEQRALSEGVDASGGFTVPEVLGAQFIDRVRNAMVVLRAGAQTVPMSSDTLHLARVAQPGISIGSPAVNAATGSWKTENDLIDESDLTLERVSFVARTLPLLLKMSVELSEDSNNIDAIVEREMSQSMALELDRVALLGSGTPPEPAGVKNQANVQTDTLGSPTNWDFLIDAAAMLWEVNHEPNAVIWSPTLATTVAKFKETVNGQPLRMPEALSGITQYRTNQVSTDVFVGDFSQLMIGMRTSFRLESSRVAGDAFERLQIWVRSYLRADVQLAHPEAFVVLS